MREWPGDLLVDRLAGSILGLLAGDALGMPVEGWPPERIQRRHGWLQEMEPGPLAAGSYTDDGQMALGLLESLVAAGGFDPAECAARWLARFEPRRGYGGRVVAIMARLAAGEGWDAVATDSYGNGAAMRVGPLGAWFFDDESRLKETALAQARITHRHPQALAGALIQALAVGRAMAAGLGGRPLERRGFIQDLIAAGVEVDPATAGRLEPLRDLEPAPLPVLRDRLGRLYAGDVRAAEAVPPALGAFLLTETFEAAVTLAVNLGRDADTLGALAGAAAGAYYGRGAIPARWLAVLEDRDLAVDLARRGAVRRRRAK